MIHIRELTTEFTEDAAHTIETLQNYESVMRDLCRQGSGSLIFIIIEPEK
jgi:hypothetical protein